MKFKKFLLPLIFFIVFVLGGCAGAIIKSSPIQSFTIVPDHGLKGGTVVTVTVITSENIKYVSGTIDIPGAYYAPLKYNQQKKAWIYRDMIPMIPIPAGEYKVIIKAVSYSGETYTAEKKVKAE